MALRTDPARLVTVRVEDGPLAGVPATPSAVDLAGVADARAGTTTLLARLAEVVGARAAIDRAALPGGARPGPPAVARLRDGQARRAPIAPPGYPPATTRAADGVALLHVAGPRFGRGLADPDEPIIARDLQDRIQAEVTQLTDVGVPAPDLLVVSGDVTESGRPRQLDEARAFLTGLRVTLGLDPSRVVIVPGGRDVSRSACEAYFHACEARERTPVEPYFPKLELWAELFADLYDGLDGPVFDDAQPWTLFAVPDLRVAIAALNSTTAMTHRSAGRLRADRGGAGLLVRRTAPPVRAVRMAAGRGGPARPAARRVRCRRSGDAARRRHTGCAAGESAQPPPARAGARGTSAELLGNRLPVLPAAAPGRAEIVHLTATGLRRYAARSAHPHQPFEAPLERTWRAATSTFTPPHPRRRHSRPPSGRAPTRTPFSCNAWPTSAPHAIRTPGSGAWTRPHPSCW